MRTAVRIGRLGEVFTWQYSASMWLRLVTTIQSSLPVWSYSCLKVISASPVFSSSLSPNHSKRRRAGCQPKCFSRFGSKLQEAHVASKTVLINGLDFMFQLDIPLYKSPKLHQGLVASKTVTKWKVLTGMLVFDVQICSESLVINPLKESWARRIENA